jgi:hypothetical protein
VFLRCLLRRDWKNAQELSGVTPAPPGDGPLDVGLLVGSLGGENVPVTQLRGRQREVARYLPSSFRQGGMTPAVVGSWLGPDAVHEDCLFSCLA